MSAAIHVIALSGGKDSTAMALRLHELHPEREFVRVVTPTGDELPEMLDHWRLLGELLGPLTVVSCGKSLDGLIRDHRMLPNWRARWCTRQLKIEPYEAWLSQHAPAVSYVGLRADEEGRAGMEFRGDMPDVDLKFPMREWGWGLGDVLAYLAERGVTIPPRTDCGSCFFQTVREWWELWKEAPSAFEEYVQQEAWVSRERGKPCTFRSAQRDTWPAGLAELRAEFGRGRVPKGAGQDDLFKQARCRVCSL